MEYQKIINLLDYTPDQPSKFRTINWVKINNDSHGMWNTNIQIRFKLTMLKSSLYVYSDAYILVKGTKTGATQQARQVDRNNKQATFKICAPFTEYITAKTHLVGNASKCCNTDV